jgi:antitoxin CptB
MDSKANPNRLNKLKFRAWHRGFLEADLILGPFADTYVAELNDEDLDQFEVLLDVPDQDLYGWIVGLKDPPEQHQTELMARIRAFRFEAFAARQAVLNA